MGTWVSISQDAVYHWYAFFISKAKGEDGIEAKELESTISDLNKKLEAARSSQAGEIEGLEATLEELNDKINQMEAKQSNLKEKI